MNEPRKLWQIADEINQDWKPISYAALPYWNAMRDLEYLTDNYGADSAESVVRYFLANASSWRGETARRVKKGLNDMLRDHRLADDNCR